MSRQNTRYHCPWEQMIIVGVAGSSGSGKSSVSQEIINLLDLPGASILVMDSFYKTLTPEQNAIAHADEYDFDSPLAIDFDVLVELLRDMKKGLKVEIPTYSFKKHQREEETTPMHPPRVLILEDIIIPRGIENKIAIGVDLVVKHIQRGLVKQANYYNARNRRPSINRRLSY
ncbi:uridine kinase [Arthroderma uncinatum]|uniref:uridine kinase n=1 Tax=Arthroderma uncinatum TaxID=74035 RepID=UPI00144AE958|nr:uridine kinase [Arthroderma uncinatum]KAF3483045.1 uridine kinase [Arthroderma uncinatum]